MFGPFHVADWSSSGWGIKVQCCWVWVTEPPNWRVIIVKQPRKRPQGCQPCTPGYITCHPCQAFDFFPKWEDLPSESVSPVAISPPDSRAWLQGVGWAEECSHSGAHSRNGAGPGQGWTLSGARPKKSWNSSLGPCKVLVIFWDLSPLAGNSLQYQVVAIAICW
jgi:hypothetical protein